MIAEQKKFLTRRLRAASKSQPELMRLKALLLRSGGEFLVAPPKPDSDVRALLESGFLISGAISLKRMQCRSCHQNVSQLWRERGSGIIGIATGYALSEDRLWRQNSWGLRRAGVLETTEPRAKYFGIIFQGEKADQFADNNPR